MGSGLTTLIARKKFGGPGGATGLGVGVVSLEGDASYATAMGGSAAQAISALLTGDPNALSEEAVCECIERYGG